ncbi:hypothetical protein [Arcobacter sp.]|uniref:hypothetical protein n=1 Tax=Arcobacter sp. TaxID=1872629 RepID=UPI003D0A7B90
MNDFSKNEKSLLFKIETIQREASNIRKDISINFAVLIALVSYYSTSDIVGLHYVLFSIFSLNYKYNELEILLSLYMSFFILTICIIIFRNLTILYGINKELFKYKPLNYKKLYNFSSYAWITIATLLLLIITYLFSTDYSNRYTEKQIDDKINTSQMNRIDFRFCNYENVTIIGKKFERNYDNNKNPISVTDTKLIQMNNIIYKCTRETFIKDSPNKILYKVFYISNGKSYELKDLTKSYPSIIY